MNNVLRLDGRPSSNNSDLGVVLRTFSSNQYGSEITAGPAQLGLLQRQPTSSATARSTAAGTTSSARNAVNEFQTGLRRADRRLRRKDDSDCTRIREDDVGYTLGQFNPQLNPLG